MAKEITEKNSLRSILQPPRARRRRHWSGAGGWYMGLAARPWHNDPFIRNGMDYMLESILPRATRIPGRCLRAMLKWWFIYQKARRRDCANCRMTKEENLPAVAQIISENLVISLLYQKKRT